MNSVRPVGIDKEEIHSVGTTDGTTDGRAVRQGQPDEKAYVLDSEGFTCVSAPYE